MRAARRSTRGTRSQNGRTRYLGSQRLVGSTPGRGLKPYLFAALGTPDSSEVSLDVAIVGAGPAGAATASSILATSPHLRVKVFERAAQLKPLGFAVHLHGNGLSALQAIDEGLRSTVQDLLLQDGAIAAHFSNGQLLASTPSLMHRYPDENGLILWHELQSALLQRLPQDTLQLGHALQTLSSTPDAVTLHFQDRPPVTAKLVIGCDGYTSVVRGNVLGPESLKLLDLGAVSHSGLASPPPSWPHHANIATSWVSPQQGANMLMIRLREGKVWWDLVLLKQEAGEQLHAERRYSEGPPGSESAAGAKLQELLATLEAAWPQDMLDALRTTDAATYRQLRVTIREPEDCQVLGRGRVTLAGEAARMVGLCLGQRLNQALEDAVELGRAIGELGPTEEALRQYEAVRQPRALRVHAESVALTKATVGGQPSSESEWNMKNRWCIGHRVEPLSRPGGSA